MKLLLTENQLQYIVEYFISSTKDTWFWVSPENDIIPVPKLNHRDFIMRKYKDSDVGWDYDKVFDRAIEDGWVRGIYEYDKQYFRGNLELNGYDKERVDTALKLLSDLYKYGNTSIYIDYEYPTKENKIFGTRTTEGKLRLKDYLDSIE